MPTTTINAEPGYNSEVIVLTSAARAVAQAYDSAEYFNHSGQGILVIIKVSAVTASPSVVVTIQGKDPASGKFYTLATRTAIITTGTYQLKMYPHAVAVAGTVVRDFLPQQFKIVCTHGDTDSATYSVGMVLMR